MTANVAKVRRAGFTLIELLIAIAIIGVLVGLLLVGISAVGRGAKRAQTVTEINGLSTACTMFKKDFGFYPPTTFTIPSTSAEPGFVKLKQMFRAWTPADPSNLGLAGAGTTLDCNQSMVYFLAGPNGDGWHPAQPTAPTGTTKKGPYFDFQPSRLASGRYLDYFGTPYAYIASTGPSGYPTAPLSITFDGNTYGPVTPYIHAAGKFVNPEGVQIISAGEDQLFGPGSFPPPSGTPTPWVPGNGEYGPGQPGDDDVANFNNGTILGSSP